MANTSFLEAPEEAVDAFYWYTTVALPVVATFDGDKGSNINSGEFLAETVSRTDEAFVILTIEGSKYSWVRDNLVGNYNSGSADDEEGNEDCAVVGVGDGEENGSAVSHSEKDSEEVATVNTKDTTKEQRFNSGFNMKAFRDLVKEVEAMRGSKHRASWIRGYIAYHANRQKEAAERMKGVMRPSENNNDMSRQEPFVRKPALESKYLVDYGNEDVENCTTSAWV